MTTMTPLCSRVRSRASATWLVSRSLRLGNRSKIWSSDRPPLQIGYVLFVRTFGWDLTSLRYQVLGVVLQQLWIVGLWALLVAARVGRVTRALAMLTVLVSDIAIVNGFMCAPTDEEAMTNAMVEWPNGGMKFPKQDIRSPLDFEQMAKLVRPEDFEGRPRLDRGPCLRCARGAGRADPDNPRRGGQGGQFGRHLLLAKRLRRGRV